MPRKAKFKKMAQDTGNGNVKPKTEYGEASIPHAITQVKQSDIHQAESRGRLSLDRDLWKVNGTYYYIGKTAMQKGAGAVLHGAPRYKPEYYGVWAAISAFHVFPMSVDNIFLYGGHTPKDIEYRPDLLKAVCPGDIWTVEHLGETREFIFKEARGYEETVGVYRHATMSDELKLTSGWLRKGKCLILDFGAFTIGVSVAVDGKIIYSQSDSFVFGILNVLEEFGSLIQRNNRDNLKGVHKLDPMLLRQAFNNPAKGYDAGGYGFLPCVDEAEYAIAMFTRELDNIFQRYGGIAEYHTVLIGGGGAAAMEIQIRQTLKHKKIYVAEENRAEIHMSGVRGAYKVLSRLEVDGKLTGQVD